MKSFKTVLLFTIVLFAVLAAAEENYSNYQRSMSPKLKKYLDNAYMVREIRGNYNLDNGKIVQSNLLLVESNASIDGVVEGNLVILNGDICLEDNSILYGDLVLVNSDYDDEGGKVYGDIIRLNDGKLASPVKRRTVGPIGWSFNEESGMSELQLGHVPQRFSFIHNRVQGLFLGLKWPNMLGNKVRWINLNAKIGYGFSDKVWRYQVGVKRAIGSNSPLYIGASGYNIVDSYDKWKITEFENTLASFTLKQDFFDYFVRRGWQADISVETVPFKLIVGYRQERQESIINNTDWSLFKGHTYRVNPAITEGKYNLFFAGGIVSSVDNQKNPHSGLSLQARGESSLTQLGSDYFYNKAEATWKSYFPLSASETIGMRIYAGSLEGAEAPIHNIFRTGGIGTVRGFPLNSEIGNRSLLGTLEYKLNISNFDDNSWWFGNWGIAVFSDVGSTLSVDGNLNWYDGFREFNIKQVQNSVGLGFILGEETGRIDVVKRTDTSNSALTAYFRFKVNF